MRRLFILWLLSHLPLLADDLKSQIKKISATEYELQGIRIHADSQEVRLPATVAHRQLPIEYLLTTETSVKEHETILTTRTSPMALQLALLLAHYQPATEGVLDAVPADERPTIWKLTQPERPLANRVLIDVEWQNADQKSQRRPLADWLQDSDLRRVPPDLISWVYNGSHTSPKGFKAEEEGTFISAWLDYGALINSPAAGNHRDDLWISMPSHIPPEGTAVTVIFRPASPLIPEKKQKP
jgi:hypothetical protein